MVMHLDKAKVTLPSDREVSVSRQLDATREMVWEAYTTPALVRRWLLGPPGWTMPVCDMDVRVGGAYRWVWRSDDEKNEFGFHGVFREVEVPSRIVHTQSYDAGDVGGGMGESDEALITVTLSESGGITTLTTLMDFGSKEARDAAVSTGMTDGMEMSYRLLDEVLAEGRGR